MKNCNDFKKLKAYFYNQSNVLSIASQLLGKVIVKKDEHNILMARIVETEAYEGITDPASHAFQNKHTIRTSTMYKAGGTAYVYLCYGMHRLFNIVTNKKGIPHAVLVRAVEPLNVDISISNISKRKPGSGPALVSQCLGIEMHHNGISLIGDDFFVADDGYKVNSISVSPRIGVDYAGDAALWPYRFFITGHAYVSPHKLNRKADKKSAVIF